MGQQETTMRATGSALRRMILVLAVAAVMAAIAMATAVPAFAVPPKVGDNPPPFACNKVQDHTDFISKHPCYRS